MKTFLAATFALIGLVLTSCEHTSVSTYPAYYNPGCYVDLYEGKSFGGKVTQVMGPATFSSLKALSGAEWDNKIGSVKTGPLCWLVIYKDADFKDASKVIPPATLLGNLGDMDDETESIKLLDHAP